MPVRRSVAASAAVLLAGVAPAGIMRVPAAVAGGAPARTASFSLPGRLDGVAATSTEDAWAVGSTTAGKPLILHWNGTTWARETTPSSLSDSRRSGTSLTGVAATSADNAWAVGSTYGETSGRPRALILHWNGSAWTVAAVPAANRDTSLQAVTAASPTSAWAVGWSGDGTLILHWNGAAWRRVSGPRFEGTLEAVASTSAASAWAVGFAGNPGGAGVPGNNRALILHWNGVVWEQAPTHLTPDFGNLRGVAATSASDAWAVGCSGCLAEGAGVPLIEHWNGSVWQKVRGPGSGLAGLWGVAATSSTNAWAVGTPSGPPHTTGIVHWDGSSWTPFSSPNPEGAEHVFGVAAISPTSAWAVGETEATNPFQGVISAWNGLGWN